MHNRMYDEQEICAIARKLCDAAAVRCSLKFVPFTTSLRVAKLQKPGIGAKDIPVQNRI